MAHFCSRLQYCGSLSHAHRAHTGVPHLCRTGTTPVVPTLYCNPLRTKPPSTNKHSLIPPLIPRLGTTRNYGLKKVGLTQSHVGQLFSPYYSCSILYGMLQLYYSSNFSKFIILNLVLNSVYSCSTAVSYRIYWLHVYG